MTKPKEQILEEASLGDFIETVSTIECFACKNAPSIDEDNYDAMEYFYKEGWRMFEEQPYCKTCLLRINNNKKK